MDENVKKAELIKEALKIVDDLGKLKINYYDDDELDINQLKYYINKAKKIRSSKYWNLNG